MAQAQSNLVQIAIIPEVTYGVTPATPQTQLLEYVSFTGDLNADQLTDPSIRADRQTSYARRGNSSTEGSLEVVLAPDNFDTLLEAALMGTWATSTLTVGNTFRSFAVEQGFTDLAQYRVFNGVVVNTLSMTITTDELVRATFGLMGKSTTAFTGTSIDSTPTAVTSKPKFFHEGGTFSEGGSAVGYLSSISFELTNNVTGNYALGATGYRNITAGRVGITGTVTALFESVAQYNKFKDDTDTSLAFTLASGAETLTFTFHRVKYTTGSITASSDAGVTAEFGFEAIAHATNGTLTVTRV
jgi:hypothetical protein